LCGIVTLVNSCKKKSCPSRAEQEKSTRRTPVVADPQHAPQSKVVTVANVRTSAGGGARVMFNELAQIFTVTDAGTIAGLQDALTGNKKIKVTVDPWSASIVSLAAAPSGTTERSSVEIISSPNTAVTIDFSSTPSETLDNLPGLAVINTTSTGFTNVVPDMATAQLMFDYIAHQCCALAGPYGIDFCLSFQYCQDGCYARAHKMCYIINNRFNYETHKIFSFANSGSDELSVQAQKWGGSCINWWYHVAPLVNIKTPTGTKAYVFDPAMFDQPVLLSAWLHAQENPACSTTPKVSMINIQPTSSYGPASYSGTTFYPDPVYADSDTTMVHYRYLITCP
jgi:hypothetical protein